MNRRWLLLRAETAVKQERASSESCSRVSSNSVVWCVALGTLASACRSGRVVRVEQTDAECCSVDSAGGVGTRPTVADWCGRLRPPYGAIPDSGCGGAFLFESVNVNVEMIPAMIMEDVRAGIEEALSKRSDR
jgi:hypothetical protein